MRISDWSSDVCSSDLEGPGREGVGRVARVHDGQLGRESLVLEVGVERLELERGDHALVADGAAGQRHEVRVQFVAGALAQTERSEEHTSELQSLMRISYAVFCLKKKN